MTAPIELSDDERQAVRDEDCARLGHQLQLGNMLRGPAEVGGPDGQLPHLSCPRCDRVWLLIPDPGRGYADADQRFRARLRDDDPQKTGPSTAPPRPS